MKRNILSLLICMITVVWVTSTVASDFTLVEENNGIFVYKMFDHEKGLNHVRVTTTVDSSISIDSMIKINTTPNTWSSWMPKVISAQFVEPGDQEYIVHIRYSSPWPVKNRESITKAKVYKDQPSGNVRLDFHTVDANVPADEDFVRIPYISGYWEFKKLDDGKVSVLYQAIVDAGGGIPKFLVNLESTKIPYETVVSMLENIDQFKDEQLPWLH